MYDPWCLHIPLLHYDATLTIRQQAQSDWWIDIMKFFIYYGNRGNITYYGNGNTDSVIDFHWQSAHTN